MRAVRVFFSRLSGSFASERRERELAEELRNHLQMQIEDNLRTGMTPEQARREALLKSGGLEPAKEAYRDRRGHPVLETVRRDLIYGWRQMRRNPSFTAVVVLTLALGIGANTAIFSVANAFLLRPLPFEKDEELVSLYESNKDQPQFSVSGTKYLDWRKKNEVFQDLGAIQALELNLTGNGEPIPITALSVTPSYLRLLGVWPRFGRLFAENEDQPGNDRIVLLGDQLWRARFGGRADVVGQSVWLNGGRYSVVGVLPPGMAFLEGPDLAFVPLSLAKLREDRGHWHSFDVIARLKPGVSIAQSQAAMSVIARQHEKVYEPGWSIVVKSLRQDLLGGWPDWRTILLLQGAVLLVLLIACANTANLLLARSASRTREIAIRLALGGSRLLVMRQLLIESVLLASLGGAVGVALAAAAIPLVNIWMRGQGITLWSEIRLDAPVLGFSLGLSLITGIVFGLAPATKATKADLDTLLRGASRAASGSRGHRWTLEVLAATQIGLALALLIGAGLVVRNLVQLRGSDPGFRPANVLAMRVTLSDSKYKSNGQRSRFLDAALEHVRATPGVRHSAVIHTLPMAGGFSLTFDIEGKRTYTDADNHGAQVRRISADYFRTMGVTILQGRALEQHDKQGAESVAIVNECLARRYFPRGDALGAHLDISDGMRNPRTVVGVVKDEKVFGLTGDVVPMLYVPYDQGQWGTGSTFYFLIQAGANPLALVKPVQRAIREIDPEMAFANVRPMEWFVDSSILSERTTGFLMGAFSLTALLMAALGIYGVIACTISQRRQEIGIRMALGAQTGDVLRWIVGRGMVITVIGLSAGLAVALVFTRFLKSLLHGIGPADPWTFAALTVVLAAVALIACWMPARRATKVDPAVELRAGT
jgi:putative ABC transport system permease protein